MKPILMLLILTFSFAGVFAQTDNPGYDKALADSLGGDDYGMRSYIFVILKTGSAAIEDKKMVDSLFKGHLENISRMAEAGKLIVAGPFGKNEKSYRGIFILNVKTTEEATELLQNDPAVKSKLLEPEIMKWYGSAALPMYLPQHRKIERKAIAR